MGTLLRAPCRMLRQIGVPRNYYEDTELSHTEGIFKGFMYIYQISLGATYRELFKENHSITNPLQVERQKTEASTH